MRLLLVATALGAAGCAPGEGFLAWWLTPDQQGRYWLARGEPARAARWFADPLWRGIAAYRAEDFASAAAAFARVEGAGGRLRLGNALAHQERLHEAAAAYREALALEPGLGEARFNLEWVEGLIELAEREYEDFGGTGGKLEADRFVFDERGAQGSDTMTTEQARAQGLSDAQLRELWMRRVATTPGDFLRLKFARQLEGAR